MPQGKTFWKAILSSMVKESGGPRISLLQKMYSFFGAVSAYFLQFTPVTPNQITILGFITGVIASLLFLKQEYPYLIIAALLTQITIMTDYIDGILARYKNLSSKFGQWIDFIIDRFVDIMLIAGITIGVMIKTNEPYILILGFIAVSARLMINLTHYTFERIIPHGAEIVRNNEERGIIKEFFYTRASIYFFMFIFALINQMKLYLLFLCFYGWVFWFALVWYTCVCIRKMIKEGIIR